MFEISEGCDPLAARSMYEKAEGFSASLISYHLLIINFVFVGKVILCLIDFLYVFLLQRVRILMKRADLTTLKVSSLDRQGSQEKRRRVRLFNSSIKFAYHKTLI